MVLALLCGRLPGWLREKGLAKWLGVHINAQDANLKVADMIGADHR